MHDIGTIEIKLRSDGRIDMCSTFMGRKDAVYAAFPQERLAGHVAKLAHWLREQAVASMRERARLIQRVSASAFIAPCASSTKTNCCKNSSSAATRSLSSCGVAASAAQVGE